MPRKIGFASGAARKSAPRNCASASARKKRSKTSGWTSTLAWQSPGSPSPPRFGRINRRGLGEDRKSTRLNSSHEWISYAVFCLKKKKKKKKNKIINNRQ